MGETNFMIRGQQHMPVIVLMDKETSDDQAMIRKWFEDSRFSTCESSNVFEALEELSDFTLGSRPDVVLLDVDSCEDDFAIVCQVSNLPVMALEAKSAEDGRSTGEFYHGSFGQVVSHLNELIPQ
jgi:DNA-binding response OmpR family regulator